MQAQAFFKTHFGLTLTLEASERVVKKLGGGKIKYSGIFYTLDTFSEFWEAAFGKRHVKIKDSYGGSSSIVFVCPYGLIQKPTLPDAEVLRLREFCAGSGLRFLEIDTSVTTGRLVCSYKNLNPIFAFVLKEKKINVSGKRFILYEVVVPDVNSSLVKLMPGVSFRGRKGFIPATGLIQRTCRVPFVQYTAHRNSLSNVVIACRPMQVIDGHLQWKVARLCVSEQIESEEESTMTLIIPAGYQCFTGIVDDDFVDGGHLQDMHIMFKLYESEWSHFHVLKFIPVEDRPPSSPFTYVAKIIGGCRGKLPVFFDTTKYNAEASADAVLATWFVLEVAAV